MAEENKTEDAKPSRKTAVATFAVDDLLVAKRFSAQDKDVLSAILDQDKEYSIEQAESALQAYKDKEVQ